MGKTDQAAKQPQIEAVTLKIKSMDRLKVEAPKDLLREKIDNIDPSERRHIIQTLTNH
jgi:hypothetical protein